MRRVNEGHIFQGMQRDLSVSKHPIQFLYDGRNIRLTARDGESTLLSVVNEKGTLDADTTVDGEYLGHCLLNEYLVLFTTEGSSDTSTDRIYRINLKTLEVKPLFTGEGEESLGFSTDYPIEAIASYESDMIQKVYWTDGNNQPRVINIIGDKESGVETFHYTNKSFDFIPELLCKEEVTVKKLVGANGMFAPGVIQYAFTYYYQYGQETNIFYTTPLYYISPNDRGASPEEKVDNAFKITVKIDTSETGYKIPFDFLRIYSIQRTSINATPFVKRIQDINLQGLSPLSSDSQYITVSYTDTGVNGDAVDPTELLYKGGESIKALTMEQKDSTLFLGNITLESPGLDTNLRNSIASNTTVSCGYRYFKPHKVSDAPYAYYNQLNASKVEKRTEGNVSTYITYPDVTVSCGGFKKGDYYRLGIQFQHKTGKWSEPVLLQTESHDYEQTNHPEWNFNNEICEVPIFKGVIKTSDVDSLIDNDYIKARAIAVFPNIQDRVVLCQGVVCPTMYTTGQREDNSLYAQSSWLFRMTKKGDNTNDNISHLVPRPPIGVSDDEEPIGAYPTGNGLLPYLDRTNDNTGEDGVLNKFREVEIQGYFEDKNKFNIDRTTLTLHSPDVEFDSQLQVTDYSAFIGKEVGQAIIQTTLSDIDIQTETPAISEKGSGFIHKPTVFGQSYGIISGLYYDDFIIDDDPSYGFIPYKGEGSSVKWPVYMWQQNGSLNNDFNRPTDKGVQSALLKKKVISNLRFADTAWVDDMELHITNPQLFMSNEISILKLKVNNENKYVYKGNIDTMLSPDEMGDLYFAYGADGKDDFIDGNIITPLGSDLNWKLKAAGDEEVTIKIHLPGFSELQDATVKRHTGGAIALYKNNDWVDEIKEHIGDDAFDLAQRKNPIRMKYKSTPHLVFYSAVEDNSNYISDLDWVDNALPIVELRRAVTSDFLANIYGGNSEDSLRANVWLPAGEPIVLTVGKAAEVRWEYGDTYYQRWDCLKTYPFTKEDINQVVEIGSFMLETRVNIDGRYDRNRGQQNNLNMSPQNFNLMNPVYSQLNNFFTYRKLDDDFYKNNKFPNQITWTKQKQSGADVDLWTNITLAAVYDMDGSKGEVRSLNAWKDQIYCFQDKGVSNILFNSRVQMPTSDGVPIEISNNYKVDGYRYLSDGIGCNNKLLVKETPVGIYFIDSVGSHLFHISDSLKDVSQTCNLTTLFDNYKNKWKRLLYDDINHDLYVVNEEESLGYSETLGQFTGFYDYGDISLIETCNHHVFTLKDNRLHKMFEGDYGKIFGKNYPWTFTFISNGLSDNMTVTDKTFTNLEFRATVEEDGKVVGGGGSGSGSGSSVWESTFDFTFDYTFTGYDGEGGGEGEGDGPKRFVPYLPVDSLETWNEYQHGMASLQHKNGHGAMVHHLRDDNKTAALKRKFRIWRCDIPRDNAAINRAEESKMGVFRKGDKPHYVDRMRNPWLYLKLSKKAASAGESLHKTEIHDIIVSYFS